jgi:hypothetical protein
VHPAESFPLYADNVVILRESRRVELAHEFLNYLLRPDVSAAIAQAVTSATPNAGARRLLPAANARGPDPLSHAGRPRAGNGRRTTLIARSCWAFPALPGRLEGSGVEDGVSRSQVAPAEGLWHRVSSHKSRHPACIMASSRRGKASSL